mmetsp:Transcript_4398/g.7741  ORF Transcript_4398/g.7741 Transcript_4398/m.7741 type:complete len:342 (-) Transcript_4398:175-1200(-)
MTTTLRSMRTLATLALIVSALPNTCAGHQFELLDEEHLSSLDGAGTALNRPSSTRFSPSVESGKVPLVVAHGMGDSCYNPGMKQITQLAGERLGVYSTCIGDGEGEVQDTLNGFTTTMLKQVEFFRSKIQADPKLQNGFDAMGLSQGNLLIRAYVHIYNDPPVRRFLSLHGPLAGVGAFPRCNPEGLVGRICRTFSDLVGDAAYTTVVQNLVAQSNYLKIPDEIDNYLKFNHFLPYLNNEVEHENSALYKDNFIRLDRLALVRAAGDTMIFPSESEWFGFFPDGNFKTILPFNETVAYQKDAFGLQTLDKAGKLVFLESQGNHLQFKLDELFHWLDLYLAN